MKELLKILIISLFIGSGILLSSDIKADSAPPPPTNHNQSGNSPAGGGTPVGGGSFILFGMALAYGGSKGYKIYKTKKKSLME
jgi:hypothetical protein